MTEQQTAPRDAAVDGADGALLVASSISKVFGGLVAVNDVDFRVPRKSIVSLIGPNGAGKTTIFDILSGLLTPDSGTINFKGVDVTGWGADRRASIGLGRSFQDARIFPTLTVAENIAIGLERDPAVRRLLQQRQSALVP